MGKARELMGKWEEVKWGGWEDVRVYVRPCEELDFCSVERFLSAEE